MPVFAQSGKSVLTGHLRDKKTKEELIGVNVVLLGTSLGTTSDVNGKYRINNVPAGVYSVSISYIGYEKLVLTGIKIAKDEVKILDINVGQAVLAFEQEVVIVGERPLVDIEQTKTERKISSDVIESAPVRQIQDILNTQTGVQNNPEGISIRGGRTYETSFLVDGVNASDPLAGTGFGVDLGSNSIDNISITTGGGDVQFGDGTAGIVNTQTKSGSSKFESSFGYKRDNLGFNKNWNSVWGREIIEATFGGPANFISKKLKYFSSVKANLDDQYFRAPANQLISSTNPSTFWTPKQDNRWSGMLKLDYEINQKTRLSFSYVRTLTVNQDDNMIRIIGNDEQFMPGFQYKFSLMPDNATTYSHSSNMAILTWRQTLTNKFSYQVQASRMFVNLRADANGRDWRPLNADNEFDPRVIVTFPVTYFNPNDSAVFVSPGPGLFNNNGITPVWHDHYVEETGLRYTGNYYYSSSGNKFTFGGEAKRQEMRWIDINRPWIGAPIQLPDGTIAQSFRLGDYSDVWSATPYRGAFYASNKIKYRGLVAEFGGRFEFWAPGKFVDDAVADSRAPIRDEIRQDYVNSTSKLFGLRYKSRLLPKVSASFPISENQMMFFNYNHSMILPHPTWVYAGLNPLFQDRSTAARVGNPNINPTVDISYELGLRSQLSTNDALSVSAYWKDKYDFITSASIQIKDFTGREVTRSMFINSDYARVRGIEVTYNKRIGKWFNGQGSFSYMIATGQSSSTNESLNQILNTGIKEDTKELFLAWDSPIDLKGYALLSKDTKTGFFGVNGLNRMALYVEGIYRTGRRYTPFTFQGYEPTTNRPIYEQDPDPSARWSKLGESNWWADITFRKWWFLSNKAKNRIDFSVQITNVFNTVNGIIINPVTGRAYRYGDPVPTNQRDPLYQDPRDPRSSGTPPLDPSRFRAPRNIIFGIAFKL